MKKMMTAAIVAGAAMLSGCAGPYSGGMYFSQYKAPLGVTDNAADCAKIGTSKMTNVLGLIAFGDASVSTAKQSVGITKVANVDYDYTNILGIVMTTKTKVCGE